MSLGVHPLYLSLSSVRSHHHSVFWFGDPVDYDHVVERGGQAAQAQSAAAHASQEAAEYDKAKTSENA